MTANTIKIGITILELILTKGLPYVADVIESWRKVDPSFEDITKLHDLVKEPIEAIGPWRDHD